MSTSNYKDYTSFVSTHARSNDYTQLNNYANVSMQTAPPSSVLKLSVAPGGEKYFSASPGFQARLDNYRISGPSRVPVVLDDTGTASQSANMMTADARVANSGDYATLGGAYKLTPM